MPEAYTCLEQYFTFICFCGPRVLIIIFLLNCNGLKKYCMSQLSKITFVLLCSIDVLNIK